MYYVLLAIDRYIGKKVEEVNEKHLSQSADYLR